MSLPLFLIMSMLSFSKKKKKNEKKKKEEEKKRKRKERGSKSIHVIHVLLGYDPALLSHE